MLILSVILLSVIFLVPLNSDGDLYQAMATDLVRYGKLPYTGSWDQNFPGIVYVHAVSIVLFGNSDVGFRLLDLLGNLFISFALYKISLRLVSAPVACLVPILYVIYYVSGGWWAIGQRDVFACAFLLGAALLLEVGNRASFKKEFALGALIGCATIIRPTYGLFLLLTFLLDRNWRSFILRCAGFTLPILLVFLPYLFTGGLDEVYLAIVAYNSSAYATIGESWAQLWERTPIQVIVLACAILGLFIAAWKHEQRKIAVLVIGSITGLVSLIAMRKFFIYHFHVLFSFLIPLALIPLHAILSRWSNKRAPWLMTGAVAAIFAIGFYPRHLARLFLDADGSVRSKVNAVYVQHSIDSSFGRSVDTKLSSYLGVSRDVELVSVTPAVHWMNELERPSRFTMIHPLTITGKNGIFTPFQERWRHEYIDALRRRRPERIVLADGPQMLMRYIRRSPKDLALEIPGFAQLLNEHYVLDTLIGGYNIYTRNTQ